MDRTDHILQRLKEKNIFAVKTMTTKQIFSKNPIFVIIVSNDDGEVKRIYYNVMFGKKETIKLAARYLSHKPKPKVAGTVAARTCYYTSVPFMDRCGLLYSKMDYR